MGNIIRRKGPVPVEATRVPQAAGQPPQVVFVPRGSVAPPQSSAVQPGVAQPVVAQPSATAHGSTTNVYITMPPQAAGHAGPVQPPPPPTEVHHHHHTTTTQYVLPRGSRRRTGTSMLGLAAVAAGVVSFAAGFVPGFENAALPVAAAGGVVGAVGLVVAILFGRSSRAGALAGILVCVLAGGYRLHTQGKLQSTLDDVKARATEEAKKISEKMPTVDVGQGSAAPPPEGGK